jgi:hypothetical protein
VRLDDEVGGHSALLHLLAFSQQLRTRSKGSGRPRYRASAGDARA